MLIINQNSGNTFVVTASEIQYDTTTGTTSGWTLTLVNETTNTTYSGITLTDFSIYPERYNLFNLSLTSHTYQNYDYAHVYLPNNGFYTYYIYYWQGTITNKTLAERGFIKVVGDDQITNYKYTKTNQYHSYKKQ